MATPTFDSLVSKLTLQKANIGTYSGDIDATLGEIADITKDLNNLEYIDDYSGVIDGNKKTVFAIKQAAFNGDPNETIPAIPVTAAGVFPSVPVVAGALQRFIERGQRWKTSAGWTQQIADALGYGASASKPDPATVKPEIDLFAAASNHHFSIVVTGRGEATMWDVFVLRKGGSWTKADTCSGKSADVSVALTTPGDAEQIQVRVQLRKSNADYGQPSDPAYVTLNP